MKNKLTFIQECIQLIRNDSKDS